ncbi:VOC family protein [Chryseobacterium sp. Bi04]|nr:hypothetical protein SRABI04_01360 [Chryseobacterium sp. Bi04]
MLKKEIIEIKNIDHLVLTVADIDKTVEFYTQVIRTSLR